MAHRRPGATIARVARGPATRYSCPCRTRRKSRRSRRKGRRRRGAAARSGAPRRSPGEAFRRVWGLVSTGHRVRAVGAGRRVLRYGKMRGRPGGEFAADLDHPRARPLEFRNGDRPRRSIAPPRLRCRREYDLQDDRTHVQEGVFERNAARVASPGRRRPSGPNSRMEAESLESGGPSRDSRQRSSRYFPVL